ncbi:MAG: PQQ-dependent sugar dehydrogenase [Planctomycetia bacterium]|nr:PQQ-dependent sugar dehydrogenase [Planctomycetia bacterium]
MAACAVLLVGIVASPAPAQLADPIPAHIVKGSIAIELKTIAAGLVAPNYLTPAGDGTDRLFITDQNGQVRVVQNGLLQPASFVDLSSRLVTLSSGYDERGLLGLAFNPGFSDSSSAGFHKLYTYTSEPSSGPADFTVPLPSGVSFNHQSVVTEWQVSAQNPSAVDLNSRREIMRIDEPQFNHNGGMLAFGADRNLYISLGDGGAANDVGNGHTANIGNGQDTSNVLGKILRIDVAGNNSANHQYGVPADNPFVAGGGVPEIYAYGLRNPFRFNFDRPTGDLLAADVGQNKIEEIDRIVKGGNFGWHVKEGTFLFDPSTGQVTADSPGTPAGLIDPLAEYDHDEGIAVIGGFVYHGTAIPQLIGKYVFGDFSRSFAGPNGRLFFADLNTGLIQELILGLNDRTLGLFIKGFGQDANGELYVLGSTALGPSGTTGVALELVPVPEPAAVTLLGIATLGLIGFAAARRRSAACLSRKRHQASRFVGTCGGEPLGEPRHSESASD